MNRILLLMLVALSVAGCSKYGRLLKSEDHEEQYAAAKQYIADKKYEKARVLLEKVVTPFMGKPQADSILFYQGLVYYEQGEYEVGAQAFDMFRSLYQRSPLLEQVEYMYAMGHYKASPEAVRDQSYTVQAIDAINTYLGRYPNSANRADLEAKRDEMVLKLHDKSYLNARTYYKIGQYKSAITALRNALKEYPDSAHREEILYLTAMSSYEYASNSIPAVRRARYLDMMERYMDYMAEFPEGAHAAELTRLYEKAREYVNENEPNIDGTEKSK